MEHYRYEDETQFGTPDLEFTLTSSSREFAIRKRVASEVTGILFRDLGTLRGRKKMLISASSEKSLTEFAHKVEIALFDAGICTNYHAESKENASKRPEEMKERKAKRLASGRKY